MPNILWKFELKQSTPSAWCRDVKSQRNQCCFNIHAPTLCETSFKQLIQFSSHASPNSKGAVTLKHISDTQPSRHLSYVADFEKKDTKWDTQTDTQRHTMDVFHAIINQPPPKVQHYMDDFKEIQISICFCYPIL